MIQVLVTSSVLITAILVLRQVLKRRISPRILYMLWALAAIRLLIPISIPLSFSVMNQVDTEPAQEFLADHVIYLSPQRSPQTDVPPQSDNAELLPAEPQRIKIPSIYLVWVAGSVIAGGYFIAVNLRFYQQIKKERKKYPNCHSRLPVYVVNRIPSPCLFGVLHPCIYLTPKAAENPQMLQHVLVHETCHYRQRDHIWSLVRALCLTIYWFDPFVWIAAACSRTDSELACDQLVIETIGEEQRVPYGKTLLELVEHSQSISNLACTATTMSGKASKIKQRITTLLQAPKTTVWVLAGVIVCSVALVSCTFTGKTDPQKEGDDLMLETEEAPLSLAQAAEKLVESLSAKDGVVSFTIPKNYPNTEMWNISVYGMAANFNGYKQAPIYLFDDINNDKSWEAGRTYKIDLKEQEYLDLCFEVLMIPDGEEEIYHRVDLMKLAGIEPKMEWQTVSITFPSYPDHRPEYAEESNVEPFDVRMNVPSNWSFLIPQESQGPLCSSIQISDTQNSIGSIGFLTYEPSQEPIAPEDEYKSVLTELRLGRMEIWAEYTPVQRTQNGESGICGITYMDPEYMAEHPDAAWASVPEKETVGITIFDRERQVYAALRFDNKDSVSEQDLQTIAQSIQIVPSDYGTNGRRYQGDYAPRDYSGIKIKDTQGNDVSKIMIDLWYCANDMYDVEGYVMFETGDSVFLKEDAPQYTQLLDYNEIMPTIFTKNGIHQYETSPVVNIQKKDGAVYRLGGWKTGYSYAYAMVSMEAIEVKEDEITARVTCEMPSAIMASMAPGYKPEYRDALFTVKKVNGVWYVDDYIHFEDPRQ